jgi:sodium-dependent dicarboxylate transporter 2/3/5
MLPVATPPNAVIFGSGKISIKNMIKAGFILNIIGVFLVTSISYLLIKYLWGYEIHSIPNFFMN